LKITKDDLESCAFPPMAQKQERAMDGAPDTPSGAKALDLWGEWMYGLKPVPFMARPPIVMSRGLSVFSV
jgi:hypothetical protein